MTATFAWDSDGRYTYPAIAHSDGRIEVLNEVPHVGIRTSIKYAQIEINSRRNHDR